MAGGLTKGPSHAKGGIKMKVKSTGQQIEVEGGEGIINKHVMSSKKKISYKGKKATPCEIASDLNQITGNGVKFDCAETEFTDMTPTDPSTGFSNGGAIEKTIKTQTNPKHLEIDAIEEVAEESLFNKGGKAENIEYKVEEKKGDDFLKFQLNVSKGDLKNIANITSTLMSRGKFNKGGNIDKLLELESQINSSCSRYECDGSTRVISNILNENGIEHNVKVGTIAYGDKFFSPHFWIEVPIEDEVIIIDYKSKMWMGDEAKQGIFVLPIENKNYVDGELVPQTDTWKRSGKMLRMFKKGGETNTQVPITKVILTDFDKKTFFGQYKRVFKAFSSGLLFPEWSLGVSIYELESSGS